MERLLALIHAALAVASFGLGNAAFGPSWNTPAALHFVLGVVLLVSAVALWRRGKAIKSAVALNLAVGMAVFLTLFLDRIAGPSGVPTGMLLGALAFVVLEMYTLRYTPSPAKLRTPTSSQLGGGAALLLACASLGATSAAAQSTPPTGVLVRTGGDVTVPAGDSQALVVVARGRLDVRGRVGTAVIINGEAVFSGAEVDEVIAFNGVVTLQEGTVVSNNVELVDSEVAQDESARVEGAIQEGARHQLLQGFWIFGALVAIGYAIAMILGSVIAATLAPHGVRVAGKAIRDEPLKVVLWTLGAWVLLPLGAVFAIPTVVGIPMGVGMFLFVLPTLAFIGYLVMAIFLGDWVVGRVRKSVEQPRPYVAAVVGTVLLLVLGLLPAFGGMVPMLAGAVGSGAVLLSLAQAIGLPEEPDLGRTVIT